MSIARWNLKEAADKTLANGGGVLDTGDSLYFTGNDLAAEVARRLARMKWGKEHRRQRE